MPEPVPQRTFTYRAFISYSHRDTAWADWLHKALETYRVPSRLVGTTTAHGSIPRRLNPVFRDREELASATDLGRKVNEALGQSENLIVLCSPASAASRWVNEEVLAYKRMGRAERIFCLIVDGEPNASDLPGRAAEECFCPALRFATDADGRPTAERAEPIAADARPGKDGKPNAKLKLIAGMLDVGFDALKQREQHRRIRRMTAITALAVCVMAVTIVLAIFALVSRHRAVVAQHEAVVAKQAAVRRQKQAEGLVNFMLGDLNDKLAQVQRLDIMQAVDDKAMTYFQSLPATDVSDTALAQRAKALEKIGSVRMNTGHLNGALATYRASAAISSKLAAVEPTNITRQVAYSRTLAFIGMIQYEQGKLPAAQEDWKTARQTLLPPQKQAPNNVSVLEQLTFLDDDLSHVQAANGQLDAAAGLSQERLALDERLVRVNPHDTGYWQDLGDAHNELGRLALQRGELATAVAEYRADNAIEARLSAQNPRDNSQRENMFRARAILGRTLALAGDVPTAIHDLQQSVDIAGQLNRFDPNDTDVKDELALYSSQLARLQRLDGDLPSATASSVRAITLLEALTKKHPDKQNWQNHYATALTERAAELRTTENINAARASAQQALDILAPMLAKHPNERNTMLATMTAKLLLARVTSDAHSAQSLRDQALQTMQAATAGRDDPRLLALQVEALLGLSRNAETQSTIARLQASGYRDPGFVAELHQAHIDYRSDGIASQGRHSTAPKGRGR